MARIGAKIGWKIVGGLSGAVTTVVARKLIDAVWSRAQGGPPPANPQQRDVSWAEAIAWTLASTAGMAISRVVTARLAAGAWERATGSLPPGFEISADTGET